MSVNGGVCNRRWRRGGILLLLGAGACSAPTDVIAVAQSEPEPAVATNQNVGVLAQPDPGTLGRAGTSSTSTPSSATADDSTADPVVVVVAGLPAPDWQGPMFSWPLNTPLHTFFADPAAAAPAASDPGSASPTGASDPHGTDKTDPAHGVGYASGPNLGGSGHPNSLSRSQPSAEQETYEHLSDADLGPWHDVHLVASSGDAADRLLGMFAGVRSMPRQAPSLVTRDAYNDRYLVILESNGCDMSADHHADNCSGTTRP